MFSVLRTSGRSVNARPVEDLTAARRAAGSFALYAYAQRGLPLPGNSQLGDIIEQAILKMSPADRASGTITAEVISLINSAVTQATGIERPVNIYSADAAILERAGIAYGRMGADLLAATLAGLAGRSVGVSGAGSGSYNALPGNAANDPILAMRMEAARREAVSLGLPWAVNNPDLLRLGPEAIRVLAEAQVRRDVYERVTGRDVGISHRTAVDIVRRARAAGKDANTTLTNLSDGMLTFPPERRDEIRRLVQEHETSYNAPDASEQSRRLAGERLRDELHRQATTPAEHAAADKIVGAIAPQLQAEAQATQAQQTSEAAARRDVEIARRDAETARQDTANADNAFGVEPTTQANPQQQQTTQQPAAAQTQQAAPRPATAPQNPRPM